MANIATIPLDQRLPNEVDRILSETQAKVQDLQESCRHDFRFVQDYISQSQAENGLMVVRIQTPDLPKHEAVCLHCSKEERLPLEKYCPVCLSPMKSATADEKETLSDRIKKALEGYIRYSFESPEGMIWSVSTHICTNSDCKFCLAAYHDYK